ncbi:MAG: GNAT family N-acetyltransferase [Candidatus Scalindua rubra]|uniref:FemAB family protein n=1 Tax=Candidatus Scalindua brodae TaxID=237368 RepID=A0A0B0EJM7_9BACT|nr:MAG: FemAB family protein [Candidatus Scalindua brodae]MBZ0108447.1 GNAT family N-acetyltransferase [Candidatus Scalindua rubra]TWU28807.1 FemAB family protein [Candidatus Brocadiaceae bacterium S225]
MKQERQKKVRVYKENSVEKFLSINKLTFERQNLLTPYSMDFLKRLDRACEENNCRNIFFAEDENQQIHSAAYIVWDKQTAYYLMGGGNPSLRNSGAASLLMWEAIKFASTVTKKFDFEGSMLEPVERFFRAFGAVQKPYFAITKINSRLLKRRYYIDTKFLRLKDCIRRLVKPK